MQLSTRHKKLCCLQFAFVVVAVVVAIIIVVACLAALAKY